MPRHPRIAIAHFADRSAAELARDVLLTLGMAPGLVRIEAEPDDWRPGASGQVPAATRLVVRLASAEKEVLQSLLASDATRLDVHDDRQVD